MLLIFTLPKLSQLDQGVKISYDILTPLLNNQWQSFICLSYLLDKRRCIIISKHIHDFLGIYDAFILHYQHMISQSYEWFY